MNNIQYQKIGLCIAGTKSRQGGFTPFVISGILAGNEDSNMDRVTLIVEKPVYVIKHTNEYILYQLIDRKVKPCDRDTLGVLSIALTITRDMQLANGKSPYTLLKEVYDKFRNDYMESDGNECDRFINKDVNPADFVSIMEQYPLEKRSSDDYISMNPSGLSGKLRVPQEKMEDLFRDTQYREFAQFKEIEFGVNCQTTLGLENIEIPRPIVYAIVLGDNRIKKTLSRPDDCFDTASVLKNTQDIRYYNISFCLKDLLNSPEHQILFGQSSVMLDMDGRCIRCKIHKEEIKYLLEYRLEGGTEKDRQTVANGIALGKIRLLMGENPVSFYSISPRTTKIPASWTRKNAIITPNYEGVFRFNVIKPNVDDEKRIVIVTIQLISEVKGIPTGTSHQRSNLNYPVSNLAKEKVKDNYKDEKKNKPQNHDDNYPPKKTRHGKRWILLMICCFVGVCIGAGIVGATWWMVGEKKLTRDDSLLIARQAIMTIPFNSIFNLDTIDINSIKNLNPLVNEIKTNLRTVSDNKIQDTIVQDITLDPKDVKNEQQNQQEIVKKEKRVYILNLVNNRNWEQFCNEREDLEEYVNQVEINAITAFLWPKNDNSQYKELNATALRKLQNKIKQQGEFSFLEDIVNFNEKVIIPFISDPLNKKSK